MLRQTRNGSNIAVASGAAVAFSGILSSAGSARLAKDADDRLDKIMNKLLDEA